MASDYLKIRADNERAYGTAIGRVGHMLLADRYDDRTHFIFELLQNAEDALARRSRWTGKRSISFHLGNDLLRVSHFGKPFDEADVRGVCGIAESTKGLTAIGRFGIGFKSVYAFTQRPEIHSGEEDFAIENFVWPVSAVSVVRDPEETVILIPLRPADTGDRNAIKEALERVGGTALLFLRELEEIEWQVEGGRSGLYLRSRAKECARSARRISVIGQQLGTADVEEEWLIFSRLAQTDVGATIGNVEVAFAILKSKQAGQDAVHPVAKSPLVAYFPTVLETHLRFLIQGPYRTTPSRDNVPRHDPWNRYCIEETSAVLAGAIGALRDENLLDIGALSCLPLEKDKFSEASMFAPLFAATKGVLAAQAVLPCFGGGHASAACAKLSRTQELRDLLNAQQLTALFESQYQLEWLSSEISADRTPQLREYLMQELGVGEVTPEAVIARLSAKFLERQVDAWILRLYEFLNGQPALKHRATSIPIIRLENGSHIVPSASGQPAAFLPGAVQTDFPTVRGAVCATESARAFLRSMGLTEPNPVDDVLRNLLPRYRGPAIAVSDQDYESDVRRILGALNTDSKYQRERLLNALRDTAFVMTVNAGDMARKASKPGDAYIATDRLKELFSNVAGVQLVDDRHPCLRGDEPREMLEACGAVRYLRPIADASLARKERAELRRQAGHQTTSGMNDRIADWSLVGLAALIEALPKLDVDQRRRRAELLWEELNHLEERRGKGIYSGEYSWTHYGSYRVALDAEFLRLLKRSEWVPDSNGVLQQPPLILFSELGWKSNPFLESKVLFKPPIIAQLAKEAGIEPDVIDLLKKLGVTSAAELSARLGLHTEEAEAESDASTTGVGGANAERQAGAEGEASAEKQGSEDGLGTPDSPMAGDQTSGAGSNDEAADSTAGSAGNVPNGDTASPAAKERTGGGTSRGGRSFVSYVAVQHQDEGHDTDGPDHAAKMELESRAIDYILSREPAWQRTPAFNEGYDLIEANAEGEPNRWCEVKAMTDSLRDRPVALSRAQFECARIHGADYWLYVVEHAGDDAARILRVQDPAGKAQAFSFDYGWVAIAELEGTAD